MFGQPRRVVGIDISDASVEIVEVEQGRALTVRALGRVTLPVGVVERGVIRDAGTLSKAIRSVLDRAIPAPARAREAVLNVPEEQVYARRIQVPVGSTEEMLRAARAAVEESVPYPVEDLVWDAVKLAERGAKATYLFVAVQKEVYEGYAKALTAAGRSLFAAFPDSFALAQAFFRGAPRGPIMLIDIGTVTTIVSVFDADGFFGSVNVPVGGETLTAAVAAKLSLPRDEAEAAKRAAGFDPERDQGKVFLVLQKALQPVIEAAEEFKEEYTNATGAAPGAVALSGGTSFLRGIDEYLESVLGVPARRGEVVSDLVLGELPPKAQEALKETPGLFAVALGLGEYALLRPEARLSLTSGKRILEAAAEDFGEEGGGARRRASRAPGRGLNPWVVAVIVIVWLAGMAGATVLYLRSSARRPAPAEAPAAASAPARVFTFPLTVRFGGPPAEGEIAGTLFTEERAGEKAVPLTDLRVGGKSRGAVTVRNAGSASQRLPSGTTLRAKEGATFHLLDSVTVPANGSIAGVAVEADAPGGSGDVGITTFAFPALVPSAQESLTAESLSPFVGGGPAGTATAAAVAEAAAALAEELEAAAAASFAEKGGEGRVLPTDLVYRETVSSSTPAAGTVSEAAAFIRLRLRVATVSVAEEDLARAARLAAAKELGDAKEASFYAFGGWRLEPVGFDGTTGTATFTLTVEGTKEL